MFRKTKINPDPVWVSSCDGSEVDELRHRVSEQRNVIIGCEKHINEKQAEIDRLRAEVAELKATIAILLPHLEATVSASHLTDGFYKKRNKYDDIMEKITSSGLLP